MPSYGCKSSRRMCIHAAIKRPAICTAWHKALSHEHVLIMRAPSAHNTDWHAQALPAPRNMRCAPCAAAARIFTLPKLKKNCARLTLRRAENYNYPVDRGVDGRRVRGLWVTISACARRLFYFCRIENCASGHISLNLQRGIFLCLLQ